MHKPKYIHRIILALLGVLVVVAFLLSTKILQDDLLHIDYLSVGQGDSTLITTPSGFQILVDGGPDDTVLEQLRQVMPIGDRSIDWVIMTHSDADHLTGLIDVIQNYRVSHVIMQDYVNNTNLYYGWVNLLREKGISVTRLAEPQRMTVDESIILDFYNPTHQALDEGMDVNNTSVVFEMEYGEISFLFTGDIEIEAEELILERFGDELKSTMLKVAHHGSKTSTSADFLEAVDPDLAVIQVGSDNDFGHPNGRVLYRLEQRSIKYWRNDLDGVVSLSTDGVEIWKETGGFGLFPQLFGQNREKVYNVANN